MYGKGILKGLSVTPGSDSGIHILRTSRGCYAARNATTPPKALLIGRAQKRVAFLQFNTLRNVCYCPRKRIMSHSWCTMKLRKGKKNNAARLAEFVRRSARRSVSGSCVPTTPIQVARSPSRQSSTLTPTSA